MDTFTHISHQGALLAQYFAAAIAMLGMGLEGMGAELEIPRKDDMTGRPE